MTFRFNVKQKGFFAQVFAIAVILHSSCNMAEHFNKDASDPENKPDEVIKSLNIKPGDKIADLGAGGGYYTLRFGNEVGKKGRVYAVDIEQEYLDLIKSDAKKAGLDNIETVLAKEDKSFLPEKSIDLIFVRNVFHHLPDDVTGYFKKLQKVLRPGGRVAIIEYNRGLAYFFHRHGTQEEVIVEKMEKAGYHLIENLDLLPKQSFVIFSVKR